MSRHQTKPILWAALVLFGFASLGFRPAPDVHPQADEGSSAPTPTGQFFTIQGRVVHGSGEKVPREMTVVLQAYNGLRTVLEESGEITEGGSFVFTQVPLVSDWVYLVGGEYKSLSFYSELLYGDKVYADREVDLPITIYETSTDTSVLHAERAQVFFGFPDEKTLKVTQSFMITNSSEAVIIPRSQEATVLEFVLPDGAEGLIFDRGVLGSRFVLTENGFGDRARVGPGRMEHQVMYSYTVPYNGERSLVLTLPMDVSTLLAEVPANGVRLSSLRLRDGGERDREGRGMHLYTATELQGGTQLRLQISGLPPQMSADPQNQPGMTIVGLGTFVLALIIVVAWMSQHRVESPAAVPASETDRAAEDVLNAAGHTVEMLLESIASLDDLYRTGKLSEDIYQSLRGELKRRLRDARGQ